ncbi:MAG: hypothetical protein EBZ48_02340, partial [Proteobacteria bacterium]|nr:hypothetical protein [Pseudomonadota bacterium]
MTEIASQSSANNPSPEHHQFGGLENAHPVSRDTGSTLGLEYGFMLVREERVEDLDAAAREYKHLKTGASVYLIKNDDPNVYFGISFRTATDQNTGIAHIAEHMAYRGSLHLPGTDPVNTYLQESLSSESNAATLADYTNYYCASPNAVDLRNQITQLLDAVFYPRLTEAAFRQEAWRVERDREGNLSLNGIVLNEMRGYASDPSEVHNLAVLSALFPDTHYRFNFAGDTQSIPELTVETLRTFVKEHNHPSNCSVVIHGAAERSEMLQLLADEFDKYTAKDVQTPKAQQPWFTAPVRTTAFYPGAETEDAARDSIVSVSWRLGPHHKIPDSLTLEVLETLLLGEGGATFKAALERSELGEQVLTDALEDPSSEGLHDRYFSIAITGTGASRTSEIEETILRELANKVRDGFSAEAIAQSIRSVSGARLEQTEAADAG